MTRKQFDDAKTLFKSLTNKDAEDNLEAFFSYVNTLLLMDIKDRLDLIHGKQPLIDKFGKLVL
jgi:hypothetical protein